MTKRHEHILMRQPDGPFCLAMAPERATVRRFRIVPNDEQCAKRIPDVLAQNALFLGHPPAIV
jgi:hypothetical protein